jgi:DNA-binding transcriptional LysR family regulator
MPPDHALAKKSLIKPKDLDGVSFVSLHADTYIGNRLTGMFEEYDVRPQVTLVSSGALTISHFVAAGLGVSLVHPLMVSGLEDRIAVRRFEPAIMYNFQLCRSTDSKNTKLVDAFAKEAMSVAAHISQSMLGD